LPGRERIAVYPNGVSDRPARLRFSSNGIVSRIDGSGEDSIDLVRIDDVLVGETAPVTIIKMDVEGSELRALHGAQKTIVRDRPTLAISIYHNPDDLLTIAQYIKSLVPAYTFYLRSHKSALCDIVLYATL
jgi:hypothetical protein